MNAAIPTAAQIAEQQAIEKQINLEKTILWGIIAALVFIAFCFVGYIYWKTRPIKPIIGKSNNVSPTCADRVKMINTNKFGFKKTQDINIFKTKCPTFISQLTKH